MAVVEVQAEGAGVELVGEALPGVDRAPAAPLTDPRHPVHDRRVEAMEVHRVRVLGAVGEVDPQQLALAAAKRRAGNAPVVGPGLVMDAGRDLDLLVRRHQLPLAQHAAAGQAPGRPEVEIAQHVAGVKAVGRVVHLAAGRERRVTARRVTGVGRVQPVAGHGRRLGAAGIAGEGVVNALVGNRLVQQGQRRCRDDAPREQLPATDPALRRALFSLTHKRDFDKSKP